MLSISVSDSCEPSWEIRATKQFLSQFQNLPNGSEIQDNAKSKIDQICEHPLTGGEKSNELAKCRADHLDSHVILWQVNPRVTSSTHLDKVSYIQFEAIVHHDDYNRSLTSRKVVDPVREFTVVMRGENTANRHQLYEIEGVTIDSEQWFNSHGTDGVVFSGTFEHGHDRVFDDKLPAKTGVTTTQRAAKGVEIGIKNKRILKESDPQLGESGEVQIV